MWSRDGQTGVVFNGEIYNDQELREDLEARGHVFHTDHSDTEVLIHGYREWGQDLPARLNGMFAFVIFDKNKDQLFLARDRFGEKPLYYFSSENLFAFASEVGALLAHPKLANSPISEDAVRKLFAWGYLPGSRSIYQGVYRLPAGCQMTLGVISGELCLSRYFRYQIMPEHAWLERSRESLSEELSALLETAVRRRLVSDVPLGVFLSGGIDSSLISVFAGRHTPHPIRTFTIAFNEPSYDESVYARMVADHIGSEHLQRDLSMDSAFSLIPEVLAKMDEPLGDPSILPTSLLAGFARETVIVALSGDGGDELFAGYDPFKALKSAGIYEQCVPGFLHRAFRWAAGQLPKTGKNMSFDFRLRRFLMGLSYPKEVRLPIWMAPLEPRDLPEVLGSDGDVKHLYEEALSYWHACPSDNAVDKASEFFTSFYLPDDILLKTDRASMFSSLEARSVFLDNELADFAARLPNAFKLAKGETKAILRDAAKRILPREIVDRPKKGFGIPLRDWLRALPADHYRDLPGVDPKALERMRSEHLSGSEDHRLFLWNALALKCATSSPELAEQVQ